MTYASNYFHFNSQLFSLNPYTSGDLDLQITQNLLQGFGRAVNGRNIRVQRNNVKVSDLQFKQQVITTVSAALNLYWDLVSFNEDVRARRQEVATAQQLLDDNKRQVQIGALAEIEVTRAEAQLYSSQQDLVVSETNLQQQEIVLKNALCRDGISAAGLENVHVVPLDKIQIPASDDVRPVPELVNQALTNRTEIATARINIESNEMNLVGIKNSLKPTLQAFAELTNNGLSGELTAFGARQPGFDYLAGGYGDLLEQISRRNFPNYSAGLSLNIPLRNRAAQSDYATSLLELRQNQLNLRKNTNQVTVDVQNAVIGLQQARVRYDSASKARELQEQTLAADQRRNALGAATVFQVIQDQRDLATSQSTEVQAMANYTHARISFDQALGTTLDVNHISLDEAMKGRIARDSVAARELAGGNNEPRASASVPSPSRSRFSKQAIGRPVCLASLAWAQDIAPLRPQAPIIVRPYLAVAVPPIRLANSARLSQLVRAGMLYLTAQDAIALALENNIDIEVSRYNPFISEWKLERAQAGGALPGVPSGASQAGSVASGQGVAGSQAAAGVSVPGARASGSSSNATVSQIGPVTQNLDPILQENTTFSHISAPQPDPVQSGVFNLVSNYARLQRKLSAGPASRRHRLSQLQRALSERKRVQRCAESHRCSERERISAAKSVARLRHRR